jgi:uncharacterized protein (TIGR00296 family)
MLHLREGKTAVHYARSIIEQYVKENTLPSDKELPSIFSDHYGVFITLHRFASHQLRGCIGIPEPIMSLDKAIIEASTSATHDPRFPPLNATELADIVVEITILTPPELLQVVNPEEYIDKIKVGTDGLIVEQGFYKGLLLPQVPVEQQWDVETFLSQTCLKAGLPPDAWINRATKVYVFHGQIFSELEPNGSIKEKKLDGS